jgi:hypothetical protein
MKKVREKNNENVTGRQRLQRESQATRPLLQFFAVAAATASTVDPR